jgi:hypothetical protein
MTMDMHDDLDAGVNNDLWRFRRGGLELLMGGVKEHTAAVDEGKGSTGQPGISMKQVIAWVKVKIYVN